MYAAREYIGWNIKDYTHGVFNTCIDAKRACEEAVFESIGATITWKENTNEDHGYVDNVIWWGESDSPRVLVYVEVVGA